MTASQTGGDSSQWGVNKERGVWAYSSIWRQQSQVDYSARKCNAEIIHFACSWNCHHEKHFRLISKGGIRHTRHRPFPRQTSGQDRHQSLVRHRVNHRSYDCLQLPFPRDPSIYEIRDAGVGKESDCPSMLVVENEVAN